MGLILIPSEVRNSLENLNNMLEKNTNSYSKTMQKVQIFSWDTELETVTYNTLKEKLPMVHGIIIQVMSMAKESVEADISTLESSIGDEELFEDDLVCKIEQLNMECTEYENRISFLQSVNDSPFAVLMGFTINLCIKHEIERNKEWLEDAQEELEIVKEKLDFLRDVSITTAGLFQNGIDLFGMAENAVHDAVVAITGAGEYSKGSNWRILLPELINEKNAEIEAQIEQEIVSTLSEELGIDIQTLEDLYGEDILTQLKKYVTEEEIDFSLEVGRQAFAERVVYNYTGYHLFRENDAYYYTDIEGIKKEATTEVLNSFFQKEADINKLLNIAYGEVGSKEIPENEIKYNNWYYYGDENLDEGQIPPNGNSYPWCAVFVSWCADEAKMLGDCVPRESGCARMKAAYQKKNSYYFRCDNYEPKAGDVFVHLNANGTGHVGYVMAYDEVNNKIYTIEGNSGNQVAINIREYDNYFDGFGSNGGNTYGTIPNQYQKPDGRDR